jgi:hypothetical protein
MHSSCCDQPTCFIIPLIALIFYLQPNGSGLAEGTCAKPGTEAEGTGACPPARWRDAKSLSREPPGAGRDPGASFGRPGERSAWS